MVSDKSLLKVDINFVKTFFETTFESMVLLARLILNEVDP